MDHENPSNISNLSLAKYQFVCRAREQIILPKYKGAVFHGGFGFALKEISPYYYKRLCEAQSRPNPHILLPPLDDAREYLPDHIFSFELTLVGNAVEYFPVCRDAFKLLGSQRGIGEKTRGRFDIIAINNAIPDTSNAHSSQTPLISGDRISSSREFTGSHELTLHLVTPLRLKDNDKLLQETPSFAIFFARTVGRINSLAIFYGDGAIINSARKQELLTLARKIKRIKNSSRQQKIARYSTRQKRWMRFDGLQGDIVYTGNFTPFWPYLALGEWLHVGGKTSFGLGKYVMEEKR